MHPRRRGRRRRSRPRRRHARARRLSRPGCGIAAQAAALSDGLAESIDLLLTDLIMPGGNGRNLASRLLSSRASLRVVLMSGYENRRDDRLHFLAKPFGTDELLAAVRQALAEPDA